MLGIKRSFVFALLIVLLASLNAFAVPVSIEGKFSTTFRTPSNGNHTGVPLLPVRRETWSNILELRLRATDHIRYTLTMDNLAVSSGAGSVTWNAPRYRVNLKPPGHTFDIWGNGFDLGNALADPAELLVMGSRGYQVHTRQSFANSVPANQVKVRSTFNVANQYPITVDVHSVSDSQNNIEAYATGDLSGVEIGALARQVFRSDATQNNTTLVAFAKTQVGEFNVGGSIGLRMAQGLTDAQAFGLTVDGDVTDTINLRGSFIQRGENFWQSNTQDANFQIDRFRNDSSNAALAQGKGSIVELVATYRSAADSHRNVHNFLDANSLFSLANLSALAVQGVLRVQTDGSAHPQQLMIVRAGSPVIDKLWAIGEVSVKTDQDGVGTVAGVASQNMQYGVVARLRYNLADNWFSSVGYETQVAKHEVEDGVLARLRAEVVYNTNPIRTQFGYMHEMQSNWAQGTADQRLFAEFELAF